MEGKKIVLDLSFLLPLFDRIRLYKSCSRGSVLKRVGKNIPDAPTLLHKFSGGSSKRVDILLKSDDQNGGSKTNGT